MSIASEFKEFTVHGDTVDLAVDIVVGTAFSGIVESLVDDVIIPPIGILIGGVDFSSLFITPKDGTPAPEAGYISLAVIRAASAVTLNVGLSINTIISFLTITAAIFVVVKLSSSLERKEVPVEEAPAKPSEEVLLSREIRDPLSRK